MKQKIFLIIGILMLSFLWVSIFNEFMANHTYYQSMLASRANRKLIIRGIISVAIPLLYIIRAKSFNVKRFFVYIVPIALVVNSIAMILVKDTIIWGSAGLLILIVNTLIIYFLGMYFIMGLAAFGTWISKRYIKFKEHRRQEMLINFWIGLGVFLLIIYVFSMIHLIRGAVIRLLFLGLGYMIRYMKDDMLPYTSIIGEIANEFRGDKLKANRWKRIGIVLLAISLIYYFYGFQLSYIPYSTARDANHAYMYIPKVIAENHGVMRNDVWGVASSVPGIRHMFITFFFALIQPIKSRFWIGPDTVAVAMNFLSGVFVLIFWVGLIKEAVAYFSPKKEEEGMETLGIYAGWLMLLFRLTSWMGAFLVFVDNKTDLGVMSLTILAVLSGFIFLKHILDTREHGLKLHRDSLKYIVISWAMFAWAFMSKQTAFIDIALFGLLLIGLRIDSIIAIGLWIMTVGFTGVMQIANARDMLTPQTGKYVMLLWAAVMIVGVVRMMMRQRIQKNLQEKGRLLNYILIWWLSILLTVVLFKWPNNLIYQINAKTFTPGNYIKSLLLGKEDSSPRTFLAANESGALAEQNAIDTAVLDSSVLSLDQCKQTSYTKAELTADIKKAQMGNEDVGRYVGYWRKELDQGNGLNLGYGFLRLFTLKNNICYGFDKAAKTLCNNAQAIENFNVTTLKALFAQMKQGTQAYDLLSGALTAYAVKGSGTVINPAEFKDQIVALRQYYQNNAIRTEAGKIYVPYRFLVPFNVVFNRSLQNLSSYYTDIWFIRMLIMMLLMLGFVYTLFNQKRFKEDTNLMVLAGVTIIWRAIRRIIGGGIVRYGMGLIVWTVIAVAMILKDMFEHSQQEQEKTMMYIIFFLFIIRSIIQLGLNFIRISSQWGGGPFLRYRMNNGKTVEVNSMLQQTEAVKAKYGRKDVFDLQFPHYNKFIDYVKNRKNTDGVLIAGTYMQYFLDNQHNLKGDGMLWRLREEVSDGNICKSYKRIQDGNIKYLVIDPNIWTVVMGEGNESLFDRFFAKKDPVTGKIKEDGAISALVKLRKSGYIKLFTTNNLGAKYAFSLSDQDLIAKFWTMSADELVFLRAKLSIARYFDDAQVLLNFIGETFDKRIRNGEAIGDIADVMGKTVDEAKILKASEQLIKEQWAPSEGLKKEIEGLTNDERLILLQYVGLLNLATSGNAQYQDYLNNLLGQSLGWGSQLMVFELN